MKLKDLLKVLFEAQHINIVVLTKNNRVLDIINNIYSDDAIINDYLDYKVVPNSIFQSAGSIRIDVIKED